MAGAAEEPVFEAGLIKIDQVLGIELNVAAIHFHPSLAPLEGSAVGFDLTVALLPFITVQERFARGFALVPSVRLAMPIHTTGILSLAGVLGQLTIFAPRFI